MWGVPEVKISLNFCCAPTVTVHSLRLGPTVHGCRLVEVNVGFSWHPLFMLVRTLTRSAAEYVAGVAADREQK